MTPVEAFIPDLSKNQMEMGFHPWASYLTSLGLRSIWLRGRGARLLLRPGPRDGRAPVPTRAAALGWAAAGALAQHLGVGLLVVAGPTAGPARAAGAAARAAGARRVGGALGAASAQRVAAGQSRRFPRGLQAPGAARLLRPRR